MTRLWKDGMLTRLDVPPLSAGQTTMLLDRVLGGPLAVTSARRLFAATRGNVLWLRHLIDGELASGRLVRGSGVWHWVGEPRLSPALTTLIETRIGELPSEVRRVLELLALHEPLDLELLRSLATAAGVEDAAERKLITPRWVHGRWRARLAHPLYGEAVRARMNPIRTRRSRGQLAQALAAADEAQDPIRRAVLAADSDLPPDPDLLLAGATQATLLSDLVLAERLAHAARDHGAGFEAQLALAYLLSWQSRGEEAERECLGAEALADTDARRLRAAYCRAGNLFFLLDRMGDAHAVLDAAAGVEVLGPQALFAVMSGQLDEARTAARRALAAARLPVQAQTYAAWALAAVEALTGHSDQVPGLVARAIAAARQAPETAAHQVNIAWWEVFGRGLAGQVGPVGETVNQLFPALPATTMAVFHTTFTGWHALLRGRVRTAAALLREFRPHFPGHGGGWAAVFELLLTQARAMTGDAGAARESLERAEAARHPGVTFLEPQFALASAWVAAAEGTTSTAVRHARRAAALAERSGQFAIEVLARHTSVSFDDRAQGFRLGVLAQRVDGPRAPAAAAHAAALAHQDPVALLAASARLEAAELMLSAADAAAQAATLHRQHGDLPAAAAAADRAAALAAACEGARTPALLAASRPLPISERQREIATLAAQLSNREIAARLGISVRTVEGHVYHACVKLGLPDRGALSALFADP
ncbi:MAG TPA: sigma factor-like helix-turn-helix DNA-binding protein [Pseudonocardiaceae bacterium]|nr:sigma factor-like helix-turn-helix DNA-binding protein [Pseudonocardiaceae bacterium]